MSRRSIQQQSFWYLEGAVDESGQVFRVPVSHLPFRVGREAGLDLSLPSQVVSAYHAELTLRDGQLVVSDLGSTNGTFVNKMPVENTLPLEDGDVVQFATLAFRVRRTESETIDNLLTSTATIDTKQTLEMAESLRRLRTMLEKEAVTQLFQPIVGLVDYEILGYEVLGRGDYEGLPAAVDELFELARPIAAEIDLSLVLRRQSVVTCGSLHGDFCYFLNTHPAELLDETLVCSLQDARTAWPDLKLAIEIHESSVTDPAGIKDLQQELSALDMMLVYDDFGAGQARLVELAEVPPDYLKFDRSLVQEIDSAPEARIRLLEGLAKMALELEIVIIAEGLESQREVDVCRDLGFSYGQGFHLAYPRPAEIENGRRIPPPLSPSP